MCETKKEIIFCSCEEKNDTADLSVHYKWNLDRFISSQKTTMRGKIMKPSDLDDEIRVERIMCELNERNCFDFEYSPKERDCLHIDNGLEYPNYKYFSLIYRNGEWIEGMNPAFGATISKNIGKGKIKIKRTHNNGYK